MLCLALPTMSSGQEAKEFAEIQVVDEATGRGVPLVELTTVNGLRFVTDSAGRVAIFEPGLMKRPVYFLVRSHGYELPADAFGYRGVRLELSAATKSTIKLKRLNIAERLYRVTGEGIYRDSVLLGKETPLTEPLGAGKVAGQDSVFSVVYRDQIFWMWGDTSRMSYPLGHFGMAGAVSELPESGGLHPDVGVNLRYFVDDTGFSRPVCRLGVQEGMIWADSLCAVPDAKGRERLVCHYAHMQSLAEYKSHGIAVYDDQLKKFERVSTLDLKDLWRWPTQAHPVAYRVSGADYLLLGEVYPTVRVPRRFESFKDLESYEAWSCLRPGSSIQEATIDRDGDGKVRWAWRRNSVPVGPQAERRLIARGLLTRDEAHGQPVDIVTGTVVKLHRGSVNYNAFKNCWVMIACQRDGDSALGEIWYAESKEPTGPWRYARKVVTHDQYSFYNPVHHAHFDQQQGRLIYFEGTYTHTFSGNAQRTPRYDYNQIMYRLDLSDPRLRTDTPFDR